MPVRASCLLRWRRQVVSTNDVFTVEAARALVQRASSSGWLCNFSYETYRRRMNKACKALGWEDLGFTPHSVRAGGATQKLMDGLPFATIQQDGRWASAQSCKIYLDAVYALAASTTARAKPFLPLLALPALPPALGVGFVTCGDTGGRCME